MQFTYNQRILETEFLYLKCAVCGRNPCTFNFTLKYVLFSNVVLTTMSQWDLNYNTDSQVQIDSVSRGRDGRVTMTKKGAHRA